MQVEKITERSMLRYVLLTLFTGGIYRLYFYYKLSLDVEAISEGDGLRGINYVAAILLSSLTFGLYNLYWLYKLGQRMHVNAPRYSVKMQENGCDILILNVLSGGLISAYEMIKYMNRIALEYNQNGLAPV